MTRHATRYRAYTPAGLALLCCALAFWAKSSTALTAGQEGEFPPVDAEDNLHAITALILDPQDQPVEEADVKVYVDDQKEPVAEAVSQYDGHFPVAKGAIWLIVRFFVMGSV